MERLTEIKNRLSKTTLIELVKSLQQENDMIGKMYGTCEETNEKQQCEIERLQQENEELKKALEFLIDAVESEHRNGKLAQHSLAVRTAIRQALKGVE